MEGPHNVMLIGMERGIPGGVIGKGRVRRTLLFFFLVMYSAIPFFFLNMQCFVTSSSYAFWLRLASTQATNCGLEHTVCVGI